MEKAVETLQENNFFFRAFGQGHGQSVTQQAAIGVTQGGDNVHRIQGLRG
jgi:hypothetical protein